MPFIGTNNREVNLDISIKFHTSSGKTLVLEAAFNQYYEVVLSNAENKEGRTMDKMLFEHRVISTFEQVTLSLKNKTPLHIFEILPPLISGVETADLADDIFEKLIKLPS